MDQNTNHNTDSNQPQNFQQWPPPDQSAVPPEQPQQWAPPPPDQGQTQPVEQQKVKLPPDQPQPGQPPPGQPQPPGQQQEIPVPQGRPPGPPMQQGFPPPQGPLGYPPGPGAGPAGFPPGPVPGPGPGPSGFPPGQVPPYPPPVQPPYMSQPPSDLDLKRKKKRKIIIAVSAAAVVLVLVATALILYFTTCLFGNHDFSPADCEHPEICSRCEETRGEPLGHDWKAADCKTPKTCTVCGATEGSVADHKWKEADCLNPRTCTVCGEVEGVPLGHIWVDATCQHPKTCSVCQATEGEPLEHTWIEGADCQTPKTCSVCGEQSTEMGEHDWQPANYQQPETCSVCQETNGTPLMPSFVANNQEVLAIEDYVSAPYTTICYEDQSLTTTGTVNVITYGVGEITGLPDPPEGYDWYVAGWNIEFFDDNAQEYGAWYDWQYMDYYDYDLFTETFNPGQYDTIDFSVNYNGEIFDQCRIVADTITNEWENDILTFRQNISVLLPIGYDGFVMAFYNKGLTNNDSGLSGFDLLDADSVVYRFGAMKFPGDGS